MVETTREGLVRVFRRRDLAAVVLNSIIGAGIFGLPSAVFALVGVYNLFTFLFCGLLVTLIIVCFAEVSSRYTQTGGPNLYAHDAFGPVVGFEVDDDQCHHKVMGSDNWGASIDSLGLIDEARARGIDITMDQYPYTASQTRITAWLSGSSQ